MDTGLLTITLSAAVPLWIERLKEQPWDAVQARARECAQIVVEKGDIIQFRSKKKGETAAAFNALAEGIAALSFVPGGVKAFGMHFEAQHPDLAPGPIEESSGPDVRALAAAALLVIGAAAKK
jgi:hypothetical protein